MRRALLPSRARGAIVGQRVGLADRGGEGTRVLQATTRVAAWRLGPAGPRARYVVELPAGAACESQPQCGGELEVVA